MVGGGSGGHITPVLAVAKEIKARRPEAHLVYVIGKGDQLADIPKNDENIDEVVLVRAGKFRRYHGAGVKQLLDVPTLLKNIRDFFFVLAGTWQSYWLLRKYKPEVIFIKGGFVSVPVGLAAAARHVAFITHDSDAVPGLANRLISRWAALHTVAQPKELYKYPEEKILEVGVPVSADYHPVTAQQQQGWRKELGLAADSQVVMLTGGGNGAKLLNDALIGIAPRLLAEYPKLHLLHIVGRSHEQAAHEQYDISLGEDTRNVTVKGFVKDLYRYSGCADLIITRAGANSLADFAIQQKACIVIPNPHLTGGHQIKNAEALEQRGAIRIVREADLEHNDDVLLKAVCELLEAPKRRQALAKNLHALYKANSAQLIVDVLLKQIEQR